MVVIVTALLIGACAIAIHEFQDRELFVSPPDAVAEGFTRAVTLERFDQAAEYLADKSARGDVPELASDIERSLGHVDDIKAETLFSTKDEALVRVRLRSAEGIADLRLKTYWDGGEWKVAIPR